MKVSVMNVKKSTTTKIGQIVQHDNYSSIEWIGFHKKLPSIYIICPFSQYFMSQIILR